MRAPQFVDAAPQEKSGILIRDGSSFFIVYHLIRLMPLLHYLGMSPKPEEAGFEPPAVPDPDAGLLPEDDCELGA